MTDETTLAGPVPAAAPDLAAALAPEALGPTVPAPVDQPTPKRRRRRALFLFLLALFGLFVLFTGWYLINRKPISEIPLPGVTLEQLPHFSFAIYGVAAPTGVAANADGSRIYAVQTESTPAVLAFDGSGQLIATLAPPNDGAGHVFVYVALDPTTGNVYVSDRLAGAVYVYSADGRFLRTFDPGTGLRGWQPMGLAFDQHGDLFVTNLGAPYQSVVEFGPSGLVTRTFAKPGDLNFPNGVAVDSVGNVYVGDSNNGRLIAYDQGGAQLGLVARGAAAGQLGLPRGLAVDDQNRVYVADITSQAVQIYHGTTAGAAKPKFIGTMGEQGTDDGAFQYPNAVAVDGRSRIYVADWRNNRIQVWSY